MYEKFDPRAKKQRAKTVAFSQIRTFATDVDACIDFNVFFEKANYSREINRVAKSPVCKNLN